MSLSTKSKRVHEHAFSLVELMVVIAIVAMLSAIAVPAYRDYIIRASVQKYIILMENIDRQLVESYNATGSFPATYTFLGVTLNGSTWQAINQQQIAYAYYIPSSDAQGYQLYFILNGTPFSYISGFSATLGSFVNSGIGYGSRVSSNNTFRSVCGQQGTGFNQQFLPLTYLPSACQCTQINTYYQNGGGGC